MITWASAEEVTARFVETTCTYAPADPGDVRFEVTALDDPERGATHSVVIIDDTGEAIEHHITDAPYEMVAAHRENQSIHAEAERLGCDPLELSFERMFEQEQHERMVGGWF